MPQHARPWQSIRTKVNLHASSEKQRAANQQYFIFVGKNVSHLRLAVLHAAWARKLVAGLACTRGTALPGSATAASSPDGIRACKAAVAMSSATQANGALGALHYLCGAQGLNVLEDLGEDGPRLAPAGVEAPCPPLQHNHKEEQHAGDQAACAHLVHEAAQVRVAVLEAAVSDALTILPAAAHHTTIGPAMAKQNGTTAKAVQYPKSHSRRGEQSIDTVDSKRHPSTTHQSCKANATASSAA
eukprot:CAMPEP_0181401982 /NCGR_PEP_ID=MMETSP1110-20121109/2939_1 /TAXON_ID=174948 /ORGANISM="Symbiodinium sp., Strain CCMP421" /LENGTH=242 /DNA_ID=CAMNT_0023524185 /DNA_START=185 /DNA_END=912 /DNA_ORIENTATION=+